MKNLVDKINESKTNINLGDAVDNVIISNSGSMAELGPVVANYFAKNTKAKLYVFDCESGDITEIKDPKEYTVGGPHSNNLQAVEKFYKSHLGDLTIFVQN